MLSELILNAKILIVDDELPNVQLLEKILSRQNYPNVAMTTDSRHTVPMFVDNQPDLVLLDLHMPHLDGYRVMELLADLQDPRLPVPIIVLTADATMEAKHRAFAGGATDFISKPFDTVEVGLRIKNALRTRFLQRKLENHNRILEERVLERTQSLQSMLTQLRGTQEQALQQERLRALGMMATGIAHDFNNLLSLIMGYGELLLHESDKTEADSRTSKYLKSIIGAARDGAEMVNRLAQFQRPRSENDVRESLSLDRLVHQAVEMTMPRWKEQARAKGINIELTTALQGESIVIGDGGEIRELLTNMIFNSVDAMPDGGNLCIRTLLESEMVELQIEDTGHGMSEEVRQRCLEPFFTTKGNHGSGLGLAMIYGIVQRHGGTLAIESEENVGTRFRIRLPRGGAETKTKASTSERHYESLRILIVDDQPVLREILGEQLTSDCHLVEGAGDGESALTMFRAQHFDLVITDKAMPGMSGEQLADALRQIRPDVRIILLTGFAENGISDSSSPAIDMVLGKPVNFTTLRQAIAKSFAHPMPSGEEQDGAAPAPRDSVLASEPVNAG